MPEITCFVNDDTFRLLQIAARTSLQTVREVAENAILVGMVNFREAVDEEEGLKAPKQ